MTKRNARRHNLPELTDVQKQIREVIGQIPQWLTEYLDFEPGTLKFDNNADREQFLSTFEGRISKIVQSGMVERHTNE